MSTIYDLLSVVSPSAAALARPDPNGPDIAHILIPGVVSGVVGYSVGRKHGHPVLGFLGAEAIGLNAARLLRGVGSSAVVGADQDVVMALTNLTVSASAIAGSLLMPKHPFWGFWAGLAAGAVATSFVEGSNAYRFRSGLVGR